MMKNAFYFTLSHFMSLVFFYSFWKYKKTKGFMLSEGIEGDQWHEVG